MTQIQTVLPRSAWDAVTIKERNEPLVGLVETEKLKLGGIHKAYKPVFLLRRSVADRLYRAADAMPKEIVLAVIEGYRSMEHQQECWDRNIRQMRDEHPAWDESYIEQQVRMVVARPGPLANHYCGGAVDVTLMYATGELFDMGTPYPSEPLGTEIGKKFPMFPAKASITSLQAANRTLLRTVMEQEGFVWYPGEWWHYCYGDRMWAVYTNRRECWYGSIKP